MYLGSRFYFIYRALAENVNHRGTPGGFEKLSAFSKAQEEKKNIHRWQCVDYPSFIFPSLSSPLIFFQVTLRQQDGAFLARSGPSRVSKPCKCSQLEAV